jgi:hypothetical protein
VVYAVLLIRMGGWDSVIVERGNTPHDLSPTTVQNGPASP